MSEIEDVVDEIVDELDPPRVEREAERLGLDVDELMRRVLNELRTRLNN